MPAACRGGTGRNRQEGRRRGGLCVAKKLGTEWPTICSDIISGEGRKNEREGGGGEEKNQAGRGAVRGCVRGRIGN